MEPWRATPFHGDKTALGLNVRPKDRDGARAGEFCPKCDLQAALRFHHSDPAGQGALRERIRLINRMFDQTVVG